ncbi:MAG: hypothetical protein EU548_02055 [Promethearchaeota archaeon]|nr:MAG: hypothetical protein EU548_02055 [Candidatus Lokiarchaeota archaeon]
MLHSIHIIEKKSGRSIFSKKFRELPIDSALLSGFLTAMNSFAMSELSDKGVENIDMKNIRWVYLDNKDLLFILGADKTEEAEMLKNQLKVINDSFIEFFYLEDGFSKIKWDGNVSLFQDFEPTLMENIKSWEEAKKVKNAAQLMDLLDIYQKLFEKLALFPEAKPLNLEDIDIMQMAFEDSSKSWNVKKLASLNEKDLRQKLREVISKFIIILQKTAENYALKVKKFVFPYIRQDWQRIKDANMDEDIINLFLI